MPLLRDGGWSALLDCGPAAPSSCVATRYAGLALQTVRLGDVLDLDPSVHPQFDGLSFDDVDWSGSAMKRASIVGFLFAGPTLDELSNTADWCGALGAVGFACSAHGIDEGTSTLLDLDLAGAPLGQLAFLPNLLIRDIDWGDDEPPIYHYDLLFVDVGTSAIGDIPLDHPAFPAGLCESIPGEFDCGTPGATLAAAVDAGAIPDYALGDPEPAILGRILEVDALMGDVTGFPRIRDVIPMIVDPAKLDYSDVPLFRLLSGQPVERNLVTYTATADVACADVDALSMQVTIPKGFRYRLGSAAFSLDDGGGEPQEFSGEDFGDPLEFQDFGGGEAVIVDPGLIIREVEPTPQPQPLSWDVFGLGCGEGADVAHVELSFQAQPYVELGTWTSSLTVATPGGSAGVPNGAPYTVVDPYEPNDAPADAQPVEAGHLYLSHLPSGDEVDHFKVVLPNQDGTTTDELPVGTLVTAVLSHLPVDFDLRLDGPAAAPLRSSPLRSSPLRSSPLRSSPIEDEGLSGDAGGQQLPPDRLQDVPETDDTLSASANRGTEADVVTTIVTAVSSGEPVTIAPSSYLGSSSDLPYTLQVFVEPPPELNCDPVARQAAFGGGTNGTLPAVGSIDTGARTLVLYNRQRLEALYGAAGLQTILDAWTLLEDDAEARPLLLPVDGDAGVRDAYAAWDADPCSPEAANDVVREILDVTAEYIPALPDLRYVTLVGSDDIIPSARVPDLVTLSNQRDYYPETVFGGFDNPISAAGAMSYVLSDSAYTDLDPIDWLGHQLLVPDLAGGRLVETPDEIAGTIAQYVAQPYVELGSSLVTAYDFLTHGGEDTQATFEGLVGAADAQALINDDWTKADVIAALGLSPDLVAVNAHYDHSNALPAFGDKNPIPADELLTSADLLASGLSAGALYFTVGCNAGLNVPALAGVGLADGDARLLDFAQAMAQKDGAGFLANTGFGYGDTVVSAYSERLMSLFAEYLDGDMTVGQASVAARQAYLAEVGLPGVYDDKVLTEATLYGLPFMRVGASGTSSGAEAVFDPFASPETGPLELDPVTGLRSSPFDLTPFGGDPDDDRITTARGDFFRVPGEQPLAVHYRPLQPAMSLNVPAPEPGLAIGDVLITDLTSTTVPLADPVFSRPTVDESAFEPEPVILNSAFPAALGNVTPVATLDLFPGQYRGDGTTPSTGEQILFTRMAGRVLYPPAADAAALTTAAAEADRPAFTRVEGTLLDGGLVAFTADVSPADLVLVLYREPAVGGVNEWGSVELVESEPGRWTGAVAAEVEEFFVQAVHGGLVGSTRGKGFDFVPQPATDSLPTGVTVDVAATAGGTQQNGWYRPSAVATITGPPDEVLAVSLNGGPFDDVLPAEQPYALVLPGTGVNTIDVRTTAGDAGRVYVPVDGLAPTARLTYPLGGDVFGVGEVVEAEFTCQDAGSGVASCVALDDTTLDTSPGAHTLTLRVETSDRAGNSAVRELTASYTVHYDFEGFFAPVDNLPTFNEAKAGQTIPLKFRLRDHDGNVVSDLSAVVVPPKVLWKACSAGATSSEIEEVVADSRAGLKYDSTAEQFVYTWQTQRSWRGCRQLVLSTADGAQHVAWFKFR